MTMYSVECGDIKFVSDAIDSQEAAAEIWLNIKDGQFIHPEITVTDLIDGTSETYDTEDILGEIEYEEELNDLDADDFSIDEYPDFY